MNIKKLTYYATSAFLSLINVVFSSTENIFLNVNNFEKSPKVLISDNKKVTAPTGICRAIYPIIAKDAADAASNTAYTLIPYASGSPITLTNTVSGTFGTGSIISFGNNFSGVTIEDNENINLSSFENFAFSMPFDGIITEFSAYFYLTASSVTTDSITVIAQVYSAVPPSNVFTPTFAQIIFNDFPTLEPGVVKFGVRSTNIAISKQTRLLLAFYMTAESEIEISGYASAGVIIEEN